MEYRVGDFIIQVKNAYMARRRTVTSPYSNIVLAIAKTLVKSGYLSDAKKTEIDGKNYITVELRYERRKAVVHDVSLVSKPSLRVYVGSQEIQVKGQAVTSIVSTSQGVMTGTQAYKKGVGGELLFRIW